MHFEMVLNERDSTLATPTLLPWSQGFGRLSATGARVRINLQTRKIAVSFQWREGFASPLRGDPKLASGNFGASGPGFATGKPVRIPSRAK